MSDVVITYSVLNELNGSLKQIITEFDKANARSDDLEADIGAPYGKTRLRDRAHTFEAGWDDRRKALQNDLMTIQERVEKTGQEWADWDLKASQANKVEADEAAHLPKAG
jgi:predicted  nucleic acid-binding Zn-ribbon protein